jgi:hypothetical protein
VAAVEAAAIIEQQVPSEEMASQWVFFSGSEELALQLN